MPTAVHLFYFFEPWWSPYPGLLGSALQNVQSYYPYLTHPEPISNTEWKFLHVLRAWNIRKNENVRKDFGIIHTAIFYFFLHQRNPGKVLGTEKYSNLMEMENLTVKHSWFAHVFWKVWFCSLSKARGCLASLFYFSISFLHLRVINWVF